MSILAVFAGTLVKEPQVRSIRDEMPFISSRVFGNRCNINDQGEWVEAGPTAQNATHVALPNGSFASYVHGSTACRASLAAQGLVRIGTWTDTEAGPGRVEEVVVVGNRFGDVALSLRLAPVRCERPAATPASVG